MIHGERLQAGQDLVEALVIMHALRFEHARQDCQRVLAFG